MQSLTFRSILDKMKGELELTDEDVDKLIAEVDNDRNGQVSFDGKVIKLLKNVR
jgi:Ca2+-binding EF-hand superfamily protein